MTTVYLIRHSVRMKMDDIESYNTKQNNLLRNEKIILSVEGEERARLLSEKEELQNIDVVYASNCVRTLQTAKYLLEKQNLKVNIDERLDERRTGTPNEEEVPNWFYEQYINEDYKTIGGESQKEVRNRMSEVFDEIIDKYENKRIAIFSHGYAITFFLLRYCKLINISPKKELHYMFNNKTIFNKRINAPEVIKLTLSKNKVENIELIEFDDIEYNHGV